MPQLVEVEGIGQVEFPDDASVEEITRAANRLDLQQQMSRARAERPATRSSQLWPTIKDTANAFLQSGMQATGGAIEGLGTLTETVPMNADPFGGGGLPPEVQELERQRATRTPRQLLGDIHRNPIFVAGQALSEVAPEVHPVPETEEDAGLTKVARAAGGFVPLLASGPAGPLVIGLQSAGEHIAADYDQAKAKGSSDDEAANQAIGRAAASGALQAGIFYALPKPLRAAAEKYLIERYGTTGFMRWLTGRVSAGGEGAVLGGTSRAAENVVEGETPTKGTLESAAAMAAQNFLLPYVRAETPRADELPGYKGLPGGGRSGGTIEPPPAQENAPTDQPGAVGPTLSRDFLASQRKEAVEAGQQNAPTGQPEAGAPAARTATMAPVIDPAAVDELMAQLRANQITGRRTETTTTPTKGEPNANPEQGPVAEAGSDATRPADEVAGGEPGELRRPAGAQGAAAAGGQGEAAGEALAASPERGKTRTLAERYPNAFGKAAEPKGEAGYDLLDAVKEQGGLGGPELDEAMRRMDGGTSAAGIAAEYGGEYDALANILEQLHEARRPGRTRQFQPEAYQELARAYERAGLGGNRKGIDTTLDGMRAAQREGLGAGGRVPENPSELIDAAWRRALEQERERAGGGSAQQKQARLEAAVYRPDDESGLVRISTSALSEGDVVMARGEGFSNDPLRVTGVDPESGEVSLRSEGGDRLGEHTLPPRTEIWVRRDQGDAKKLVKISEREHGVRNDSTATPRQQRQRRADDQAAVDYYNSVAQAGQARASLARRGVSAAQVSVEEGHGTGSRQTLGPKLQAKLEQIFGVRIVLVEGEGGARLEWNGVSPRGREILVNVHGDHPLLTIVGHELGEVIFRNHADVFSGLMDRLIPMMRGLPEYQSRLDVILSAHGRKPSGQALALKELANDFIGDQLSRPEFWDRLAGQDRNLFRRVAQLAIRYVDRALEGLRGLTGYGVEQHFTDLEQARRVVAEALQRYAQEVRDGGAQPPELQANEHPFSLRENEGDKEAYDRLLQRRDEITARLNEIGGQAAGPTRWLSDELKSERFALAKESREIQRALANHPEHVADLFRRLDRLGQELENSRRAGNALGARTAADEMQGIMDGDLALVPDALKMRIYHDLVARGEIMGSQTGELPTGRTLGGLTAWLEAQKINSPKLTLRERFGLAARLADRWNRGADALKWTGDRVASAWRAFVEQYKHPPIDGDFRSTMKDWFYQKEWTGMETYRWVKEIDRQVPQSVRQQAISVWLEAGGNEGLLRSQAEAVPPRFRRVWETALKLTDQEKQLARRIQVDFETKLEDAKTAGLLERGREDYGVPQIWRVAPKVEGEYDPFTKKVVSPRRPGAQLDPRAPFFSMRRTSPTYFDGIMAGGIPKGLEIGKLVGAYNAEFHNSLSDRAVIKALSEAKDTEGNPIVMISGAVHIEGIEGGKRVYFVDAARRPREAVTKDGRPYREIDHWALKKWKVLSRDADGNPIVVHGDFLVHPDYYRFLKNELGQSWLRTDEGRKYFGWMTNSAAFMKASKFASATFHLATIGEHAMFHAVLPITRGVVLDPLKNPKLGKLMRHGLETGFGHYQELFEDGLASHGGLWSQVPGLGDAMRAASDFLFKDYIPKIKAKVGLVVLERNMRRYGSKLSEDQIYELTAQQMNAAFGLQHWRLMGTNKTMLDVNRLLLTAPDFLLARSKVVAQALKPYGREQRYFLLAQAGLIYMAARALNVLLDDDAHWEPENALGVVYNGRVYSARFLVNDIWHLLNDPSSFAQGRLGPWPRAAIEATTKRDMRTGARIDVPFETNSGTWRTVQVLVKDLVGWLAPVGTEGLLPGAAAKEQTGPGQVALALVGVGSRRYRPATQVWQWAADFNRHSPDPAAVLYQKRRDADVKAESVYRKLDVLLEADKVDQARREFDALVAEGYKPVNIAMRYRQVRRPFTGSLAREALFRANLTPEQSKIYQRAIQERIALGQAFGRMLQSRTPEPAALTQE